MLVTEWKEFTDLPLADLASLMAHRVLVDGRNVFKPESAIAAGFDYTGVGRCARPAERREAADNAVPSVSS